MLSAIVAVMVTFIILLVIWVTGKMESCCNVPDRYEYPKKECRCDDEFITISGGRKLPNPDYKHDMYIRLGDCDIIELVKYMSRGNRDYLRGDGVKVVLTVKR